MAKRCKSCNKLFKPTFNSLQVVCGVSCSIAWANTSNAKEYTVKAFKDETRDKKKNHYDNHLSTQLSRTQKVFNKLRVLEELKWFSDNEIEPECISCGKNKMDWCCGHFKTVGSSGIIRFDRKNTFLQCNRYCNMGLSGNIEGNKNTRGYKVGLVERFGDEEGKNIIEYCESMKSPAKWDCQELIKFRKECNEKIRELNKELS